MDIQTKQQITLHINGNLRDVLVRCADTLLETLRNQLGLVGAKPGCGNGDCGACTVLINNLPINACHILSIEAVGFNITTIEGLKDTKVHEAFINNWAIQCGYCTPGFILNIHALLEQHPDADDATIDVWLDSNICRCTGYQEIKETVKSLMQMEQSYG
ncbi:MAG TPA: (2Fe-2S)-binding protein [Bacillota bacterium]|nr:(2Fe-2S)-binding protein [Bacillota bacterium]